MSNSGKGTITQEIHNYFTYLQGRYIPTCHGYAEGASSKGWLVALLNYADAANHFDSNGIWNKRNEDKNVANIIKTKKEYH